MKEWGIIGAGLVLALLAVGVAEAWYPHGPGPWHRGDPRTAFSFGFDFVVPLYPYPVYPAYPAGSYPPAYVAPPVYAPQRTTYTTPGYYRQVPWYTDPGGFTTFRQEWIPPSTTQVCR
ncbi:MAG: hypothetical protein ACHQ7N_08860 [Candidatus Methylomirabilales bacterium]